MAKRPTVILSLGGSIIVPDAVDTTYLRKFTKLINQLSSRYRFVIFTGGGSVARDYQDAGRKVNSTISNDSLDWIGIQASLLNAQLVKQLFGTKVNAEIITDPRIKLRWKYPIFVGAGWKPGRSTDYDAVRLAVENDIHTVINLSNIDYVYTKDPQKFKTAEKIVDINWKEFRKIIGSTWDPGLNVPFDPIAAKIAQKHDVTVRILNGNKLDNVRNAITNKSFRGTTVTN